MGTRADFYLGRGKTSEWLGSIAWDGDPQSLVDVCTATTKDDYLAAVASLSQRSDWSCKAHGWPWPWEDSHTTDFAYTWDDGVHVTCFGYGWRTGEEAVNAEDDIWSESKESTVFPDMTAVQNVTYGSRSGVMVVTSSGLVPARVIDEHEGRS